MTTLYLIPTLLDRLRVGLGGQRTFVELDAAEVRMTGLWTRRFPIKGTVDVVAQLSRNKREVELRAIRHDGGSGKSELIGRFVRDASFDAFWRGICAMMPAGEGAQWGLRRVDSRGMLILSLRADRFYSDACLVVLSLTAVVAAAAVLLHVGATPSVLIAGMLVFFFIGHGLRFSEYLIERGPRFLAGLYVLQRHPGMEWRLKGPFIDRLCFPRLIFDRVRDGTAESFVGAYLKVGWLRLRLFEAGGPCETRWWRAAHSMESWAADMGFAVEKRVYFAPMALDA